MTIRESFEKVLRGERLTDEERLYLLDWMQRAENIATNSNPVTGQISISGPTQYEIDVMVKQAMESSIKQYFPKLSDITQVAGLLMAGEFRSGNFKNPGDGFTGGRFGYPGFTYGGVDYFLAGVLNDVLQVGLSLADGTVYAGAGGVYLDADGVTILKGAHSADIADVSAVKWLTAGGVLSAYIADQNISTVEDLLSMRKTRADGETQTSSKIRLHLKNEDAGHSNSGAAITLYGDATDTRIRLQIGQVGGNLYNTFTAIQTGSNTGNIILNADQIDMDTQVRSVTDANLIIADAGLDAVGIGASSPAYKLDVNGDINARQGSTLRIAGNDTTNGWIPQGQYTWTRTGNYTFTVSGDVTTAYRKGTKVRYKDGGSYEYGVIYSSTYSAPNTTVTLITNSDYAMAAATITDKYISYIENPEGFPAWFNVTVGYTGFSSNPTTLVSKWRANPSFIKYVYVQNALGTSNAVTFTITGLPAAVATTATLYPTTAFGADNSANLTEDVTGTPLPLRVDLSGTTISLGRHANGNNTWTASGTKGVYALNFDYEY